MSDWIDRLRDALAAEERAVVVTVAATRGSVPREPGARMIATRDRAYGTIGGGHLEFEAIRIAREALANGSSGAWLARFPLAARLGQCCGGVATVLFQSFDASSDAALEAIARRLAAGEVFALATAVAPRGASLRVVEPAAGLPSSIVDKAQELLHKGGPPVLVDDAGTSWFVERATRNDFRVVVFGNGHVGRALVQVLGALPCVVTWVDEREHDFPASVPANVDVVVTDVPEAEVRAAVPGSMFLVMTHRHALDFDLVVAIAERADFSYAGMIGSAAKRAQMERRLATHGIEADAIARIVCPIGIAGIDGREPGAIAVAVAAELLQRRERGAARHAEALRAESKR
jgi:xanthine dehydrogenase accessory factor